MLENGFSNSRRSETTVEVGNKAAESTRSCCCQRKRWFCFVLLVAAILFFYNVNVMEMAADWSPQWIQRYNATAWWMPYKSLFPMTTAATPPYKGLFSTAATPPDIKEANAVGTTFTSKTTDKGKIVLSNNSSSLPTRPEEMSATTTTASTITVVPRTTTTAVSAAPRTTPPTTPPPPYVSPGPYLVEYPHRYRFTVDEPEKCRQQKPFVVLVVPVAPHNRAARDAIRATWGGESPVSGKVVSLFFLLGLPTGREAEGTQRRVLEESREHRDLLQADFVDCYKNLTIKTMVMLEWLDSRCAAASYAMKIDSDMFLNVRNLVHMLLNAPDDEYMTGLVAHNAAVLRNPHSKWYLPYEVFPESQYPHYALGLGYVLSLDLPGKLVEASRHVKAVYIEDVYLGLCMRYLGIPPTDPPNWYLFQVFPVTYSRCSYSRLIAITTNPNMDLVNVWKDFNKPGPYC